MIENPFEYMVLENIKIAIRGTVDYEWFNGDWVDDPESEFGGYYSNVKKPIPTKVLMHFQADIPKNSPEPFQVGSIYTDKYGNMYKAISFHRIVLANEAVSHFEIPEKLNIIGTPYHES